MDKANLESQIIILQGKLEDTRHSNSNVEVEVANVQKAIQNYKLLLLSKDHAVEKAKATLEVSRGRIESTIHPKEAALQKAQDLLAAAREKLNLLKAEEAEKAQIVEEAHEGLKAAQERLVAAEKRLSDVQNAPDLLVKAQSVLAAAVANLENKKDKLEAEFNTLQSYQGIVEHLNSQYEDLASRMDPAILEAADMPMDIRSSNPTTFSDSPAVLPTHTNSPQVQAPKASPASKQEAKVEEIKPKKENSQAVAESDSSKYAAATTGVFVGLIAGLFGFKKKKQSSNND